HLHRSDEGAGRGADSELLKASLKDGPESARAHRRHAALEARDQRDADARADAGEVGRRDAQGRRRVPDAARAPAHHRRDPLAARRSWPGHRDHRGEDSETGRDVPTEDPHRRSLRDAAQLHRRGPVPSREPREGPLLFRRPVPTGAARAKVSDFPGLLPKTWIFSFIGIHPGVDRSQDAQKRNMDESCYEKCLQFLREDHQVLVFVHSRNATGAVAKAFVDKATVANERLLFLPSNVTSAAYLSARKSMNAAKSQELKMLFQYGLGIHHAGLVRPDRTLIERMFRDGHIRVLVCTATLAWGVNLPAHAVIIRGTEIFDPQKGVFTDIGVLDVQQIFGRAGRPQYESSGHGVIITTLAKIPKYVGMLIRQTPIESQFQSRIHDNLNAEIAR
ncbi:Protein Y54E2A.4, partial [Aphelenchoides avenae]